MALTVANTTPQSGDVWGRQKTRIVTVTFDSSYPTGGESFTPAMAGLSTFTAVFFSPDSAPIYQFAYDYTNQKILVAGVQQDADAAVTDPFDEEDNAVDLSTVQIRVLCVGH